MLSIDVPKFRKGPNRPFSDCRYTFLRFRTVYKTVGNRNRNRGRSGEEHPRSQSGFGRRGFLLRLALLRFRKLLTPEFRRQQIKTANSLITRAGEKIAHPLWSLHIAFMPAWPALSALATYPGGRG